MRPIHLLAVALLAFVCAAPLHAQHTFAIARFCRIAQEEGLHVIADRQLLRLVGRFTRP